MKKIVVLDGKTLGNVDYIKLNEFGQVVYYDMTYGDQVAERISDADIILTNKVILKEEQLKNAPNLKLICEMATGYNNIDIKYARKNKIAVTNVAGYSTNTVAQHTFAMLLHLYNNISYFDEFIKSGEYSKSDMFTNLNMTYNDLCGKVWGIIGLGAIGKRVAKIAQAFGARVVYYSTSGKNVNPDYAQVSFEELLDKSDVISIHSPLNEKTKGLINYEALSKMKKDSVLINVGRGPIVVDYDLARAIDEEIIGGAALDVFDVEPIPQDNPLLGVRNKERLVMTPHVAWASEESRKRLFDDLLENISAFNRGEFRNRVD
ncbi:MULTISPECIES: D-2-hydroxyacid dehydrogenase [Clostridium]|uniref:D-2-hydroxyacid dehydrogenase n=2 Tax=Clostridium butyricum TaxID=1492 RepID=A0AAP9RGP3_CLOBU|nr:MULTISPECIES: D-2-hydroxyacid dehydrogenase [Clostridium]ALP89587.1 hydroxyacid dehydrogenase [Clostridium butyricum]ALS16042.1 hydroxyacid dehydrogenase [Clostridium butyricum]ANF13200.1 hydroxyacid dehydrogenase [Clostridium butyricum]AOR93271.1 hydroxyacid dehydrogenase [Clostridium butyricum]AXB85794.1 D-2-hydroxyacid dehydrogenase [Clostridium butyricum]